NAGYRADVEELLALCADREVAVQTIKAVARRRWPDDADEPHHSWYQPLRDAGALARAAAYVLSDAQLFLTTSGDASLLPAIIAAASGDGGAPVARPSDEVMR